MSKSFELPRMIQYDACGSRLLLPGHADGNQNPHLVRLPLLAHEEIMERQRTQKTTHLSI